jgi:hypothetical protein
MTPLALTDQQFRRLMDAAEQLHSPDRDPFLRAVGVYFAGKSDIGDGEFARGVREELRGGRFRYAMSRLRHAPGTEAKGAPFAGFD